MSQDPAGADDARVPAAASADPAARVLRRFRQVFTAARTHYQLIEKRVGVGGAQFWALGVVGDHPGIGINGLARAMHVHQSTASNLVRGLVERGLIATTRDDVDRRAVQLRLLPEAQAMLDRAPGPYIGLLPQSLARLDVERLVRLEADLMGLLAAMGMDEDAPATPIAQL
ncbi:MAG: MarR family winged helix-turn-helix transcriptional regulator [Rubrivivax sp.]